MLLCVDCEGIEIFLFFEKDGIWVMNECYFGVCEEFFFFVFYGIWVWIVDKLVLIDSKGEKLYYWVKGDVLEMFDCEGNLIEL